MISSLSILTIPSCIQRNQSTGNQFFRVSIWEASLFHNTGFESWYLGGSTDKFSSLLYAPSDMCVFQLPLKTSMFFSSALAVSTLQKLLKTLPAQIRYVGTLMSNIRTWPTLTQWSSRPLPPRCGLCKCQPVTAAPPQGTSFSLHASPGEYRSQLGLSLYWSVQETLTENQRKDYEKIIYSALIRTGSSCGRLFFSKRKQRNIAIHRLMWKHYCPGDTMIEISPCLILIFKWLILPRIPTCPSFLKLASSCLCGAKA